MKARFMKVLFVGLALTLLALLTVTSVAAYPDEGAPVAKVAQPKVVMPDKWIEHIRAPADVHLMRMLRDWEVIPANATQAEALAAVDEWYREFYSKNPNGADPVELKKRLTALNQFLRTGERQAAAQTVPEKATLVVVVDFSGPDTIERLWPDPSDPSICTMQTFTFEGPGFGETAPPGPRDNFTLWKPTWTATDYEQLYFGVGPTAGIGIVRPDLGGIDLSGLTMANYVLEQSGGTHMPRGDVLDKVLTLPHAHNWYGAARARQTDEGCEIVNADTHYLEYFIDAIEAMRAEYPDLDYSQFDTDGDHIVDLFAVIHAGWDWQTFGGVDALSTSSSSFVAHTGQPYQVAGQDTPDDPSDDYFINGVNVLPEQLDAGAICEEYEHQFGLPDIYTTDVSNSNAWWGSHSAGVWGGPVGGMRPMGHNLWQDVFLGWRDPLVIDYNAPDAQYKIGQARYTPAGTEDGLIIRLPDKVLTKTNPLRTGKALWGGDIDEHDSFLYRSWDLSAVSGQIVFSFDLWWDIEEDWDYFYFEVSTDGVTYTSLPDLTGKATDSNPNGTNIGWGVTGTGQGRLRYDLSAYAGMANVWTRLRYKTDAAVHWAGPFVDNISVDADSTNLYTQDFETDYSDWTNVDWIEVPFTANYPRAYFVEWRTKIGFDQSFDDAYYPVYANDETAEFHVDRTPYTVPALQLTLYDSSYDFDYTLWDASRNDPPSYGPKYPLLVVDSHYWPYIFDTKFPNVSGGWVGPRVYQRSAAGDAGFGLRPTREWTLHLGYNYRTGQYEWPSIETKTFPSRPPVPAFHDYLGYYPGFFYPGTGPYVYGWDSPASTVVPAKGNYTTKITWLDGSPLYELYGVPIGPGGLGDGNPWDKAYGVNLEVLSEGPDATYANVKFYHRDVQMVELTPSADKVGYVDSSNRLGNYLGSSHMYGGLDTRPHRPRTLYPTFQFDLGSLPAGAKIIAAEVDVVGRDDRYMDAFGYGAWHLQLLDSSVDLSPLRFWDVDNAGVLASVPPKMSAPEVTDYDLAPDLVNTFIFSEGQLGLLQNRIDTTGRVTFRIHSVLEKPRARNIFDWYGAGENAPVLRLIIQK